MNISILLSTAELHVFSTLLLTTTPSKIAGLAIRLGLFSISMDLIRSISKAWAVSKTTTRCAMCFVKSSKTWLSLKLLRTRRAMFYTLSSEVKMDPKTTKS